ncbi:MAG: hypothetical protein ACOYOK_05115 [Pseudobdellovibrionaceae bacterium]
MKTTELIISSDEYFSDLVKQGINQRKVKTYPLIEKYLTDLLKFYLDAQNLHGDYFSSELEERKNPTLAEVYLVAQNTQDQTQKRQLLKKLADRSLYISGFFGDSLERKIVDIDYYIEMGGVAYGSLAHVTKEDTLAKVYRTFSKRFVEFVDVLTYISQQSLIKNNQSLLRLYDRYLKTGSLLAKEKLIEMGVVLLPTEQVKLGKQG